MGFLGWMNPLMPWFGLAAISSPIIIHLLNKRRFKIVNWAAMDFLFEADKKNRRRVRLENFILLMLRCLAMLLIGLFLARPFLSSEISKFLSSSPRFEHIVVLDDSLSQRVQTNNQTSFDKSKDSIKQLLESSVNNNDDDWLTLIVTSQPDKPLVANEPINDETLNQLLQRVDDLEVSDQLAKYDDALQELERQVSGTKKDVNRVVYIISDLRENDWLNEEGAETAPNRVVKRIGENENVASTFVVDVGQDVEENLTITSIQTEDQLIANTVVRFNVTVLNQGRQAAQNIQVRFQVSDKTNNLPPQFEALEIIRPGESETITFRYMFNVEELEPGADQLQEKIDNNLKNYKIQAEIVRDGVVVDSLAEDSSYFYAARVLDGIPVLLVDGDPSSVSERSETHFLRSLDFLGTGLLLDTITASELETISLSKYRVIFLCNVDEAGTQRIQSLKQWVANGGGLVFMPGDQVRASTFNESFYQSGLSPFRLLDIRGDTSLNKWVHFEVTPKIHPALKVMKQADDALLENIEVFSWWGSEIPKDKQEGIEVAMRFSDDDNSIAMAERTIGKGRVIGFTVGADADWTMWPVSQICYPLVILPLIEHLVGNVSGDPQVAIGGGISYLVDMSNYDRNVALLDPANEKVETKTTTGEGGDDKSIMRKAIFDDISRRGIYELQLKRRETQQIQPVLFAANVDPAEGNLRRLNMQTVGKDFFGSKTRLVSSTELVSEDINRRNSEFWWLFLVVLAGILGLEQFLGWWWGRKR